MEPHPPLTPQPPSVTSKESSGNGSDGDSTLDSFLLFSSTQKVQRRRRPAPREYHLLRKNGGRTTPLYEYSAQETKDDTMLVPCEDGRLVHPISTTKNERGKEACLLRFALGDDDVFNKSSFEPGFYHNPSSNTPKRSPVPSYLTPEMRVAEDGSLSLSKLVSSQDVINFFANPARDPNVKFITLIPCPECQRFDPYELKVTKPHLAQNREHYVFSSTGVVHVSPNRPTEVMLLSEWIRETSIFSTLRRVQYVYF